MGSMREARQAGMKPAARAALSKAAALNAKTAGSPVSTPRGYRAGAGDLAMLWLP